MILLLAACAKQPDAAPATFEDLVVGLYADFDDTTALQTDLQGFADWLESDWDPTVDGYSVRSLSDDDVADVDHPSGRDPADAVGGTALAASPHTMDQHVAFVLLADQSVVSDDYHQFDRTYPDEQACFDDADCPVLETWNVIDKTQLTGELVYSYEKDYRRVELEDGTVGVVARGAVGDEVVDGSTSGFYQSYNQDVFLPWEDGIVRLQTQWTEVVVVGTIMDGDAIYPELISGIDDVLADTDTAIDELAL